MKMKTRLAGCALATLLLALSGCAVTLTTTNTVTDSDVSGVLVDARSYAATGLPNATMTLTSISNSSYTLTSTTDSSGNFSFTSIDSTQAPYQITGFLTGYFIAPVRVNTSGYSMSVGNVPALLLSSTDAATSALSFVTVWNTASTAKIDPYLSFPDSDQSTTEPSFTTPYADTLGDLRTNVYYGAATFPPSASTSTATVYLNETSAASDSSGASVLTLRTIPFGYTAPANTPANYPVTMNASSDTNGLYATFHSLLSTSAQFRYMGAAELYLNAPTGSLSSSSGASSNPDLTVYCIQTTKGPTATLLSSFQLLQNVTLTSASVLRVNMFLYYDGASNGVVYQVVVDQKWIPLGPTGTPPFKSVTTTPVVFGVLGK